MRLTPVQTAKIAVERPSPPLPRRRRPLPAAPVGRRGHGWPRSRPDRYHSPPTDRRRTARVANIKQQKKRNRRSLEQRDRNLRYRSTIKTLFRRLGRRRRERRRGQVEARARRAGAPHRPRRRRGRDSPQQRGPQEEPGRARSPRGPRPVHRLVFAARRRPPAARQGEQVPRRRLQHQPLAVVPASGPGSRSALTRRSSSSAASRATARWARARRQRPRLLGQLARREALHAGGRGHGVGVTASGPSAWASARRRKWLASCTCITIGAHRVVAGREVLQHVVGPRGVRRPRSRRPARRSSRRGGAARAPPPSRP